MTAVPANPYPFEFDPRTCALVIIDMQRDFVGPGGFGAALGNDVSRLRSTIGPIKSVLQAARKRGMLVIHTREGHRPGLADLPDAKRVRGQFKVQIGDKGPMGRILVLEDCVGSYSPEFQAAALKMITAQGGIFGWVSNSRQCIEALS